MDLVTHGNLDLERWDLFEPEEYHPVYLRRFATNHQIHFAVLQGWFPCLHREMELGMCAWGPRSSYEASSLDHRGLQMGPMRYVASLDYRSNPEGDP